jgi:hypothetical protein
MTGVPGSDLFGGQWSDLCSYVEDLPDAAFLPSIPYCGKQASYWLTSSVNRRTFPACADHAALMRTRPTCGRITNRMPVEVT